jgi:hypothetical protein
MTRHEEHPKERTALERKLRLHSECKLAFGNSERAQSRQLVTLRTIRLKSR